MTYTKITKPTPGFGNETWSQMTLAWEFANGAWADSGNSYTNVNKPSFPVSQVLDQSQTSEFDNPNMGDNTYQKMGQTFKPSITAQLAKFQVVLGRNGNPIDNALLQIYSSNGSTPGGLLATADNVIAGSSLLSGFGSPTTCDYNFTGGPILVADTTYWAVLSRTGAIDSSNCYRVFTSDTKPDPYPRGALYKFINGVWSAFNFDSFFYHYVFNEYYQANISNYTNIPKPI